MGTKGRKNIKKPKMTKEQKEARKKGKLEGVKPLH